MLYPKPFRRSGTVNLFFAYIDPLTGKRKQKACRTSKVGKAQVFIKNFMNSLTEYSNQSFEIYSSKYLVYETSPRKIRLVAEGKKYGRRHVESLKLCIEKYVYPDKISKK